MKSSWINKLVLLLACASLGFAQDGTDKELSDSIDYLMNTTKKVEKVIRILRAFQPDEALQATQNSGLPKGIRNFLTGWAYHQKGDYKQASQYLGLVSNEDLSNDSYFTNRLKELKTTADQLQSFKVHETENFSIRYQEGRDAVMLNLLPEVLESIYASYADIFDFDRGPTKIIVELMPDHELFAYASALTREQIETTGTIALCVENRLAILTPRRVAQGYYWPDVIAHEFVHFVLTRLSRDKVPLWMQEGTAKYFETRWENSGPSTLDPSLESALAQVLQSNGRLITTEEMMPSFAALPTAQLARQAYAQTTTMIDYLSKTHGESSVRALVIGLRDHKGNVDRAMKAQIGVDFKRFQTDWETWLRQQSFKSMDQVKEMGVELLDSDRPEEQLASLEAESKLHKKHLRLGDLLLERKRYLGALKEYKKIIQPKTALNRQIVLRLVECYRNLSMHQDIVNLIEQHVPFLEEDTTMLVYQARAYVANNQGAKAEKQLDRALRINPFHPGIYHLLIDLKGETSQAGKRYKDALSILKQPANAPTKERKS